MENTVLKDENVDSCVDEKTKEVMKLVAEGIEFYITKYSTHIIEDAAEKEKLERLKRLVELNYIPAYGLLGEYYYLGSTSAKSDMEKALNYFEKGAEQNDALSLSYLAEYYGDFEFSGCNREKAFDYAKRAFAAGNVDCGVSLGEFYEKGEFTEKNIKQAVECYKQAQCSDWDNVRDMAEQQLSRLAGEYWVEWVFEEDWTEIDKTWDEILDEYNITE